MLTPDDVRKLIPRSVDRTNAFLTKRHEEIDYLLCAHVFTQYELELLKQDVEMTTRNFEIKARGKMKRGLMPPEDLWTDGGDHA